MKLQGPPRAVAVIYESCKPESLSYRMILKTEVGGGENIQVHYLFLFRTFAEHWLSLRGPVKFQAYYGSAIFRRPKTFLTAHTVI